MTATQATGNQSSAVRVAITMGDDVSTDAIYPGRFMATVLPAETPQYAFADDSEFRGLLKGGSMPSGSALVAGTNFGCGSSREQAASALRGHNLVIIARGFARIFLQNAINLGLQVLVCPGIEASAGDLLEITAEGIHNRTTGRRYDIQPLPAARQAIMKAGGLIAFTRQRLRQR